jgi:hypothetical protein
MRCAHLPYSVRKRFNNTQLCRRKSKLCGRTLGSTIRSPLTGSHADHAAVQKLIKIPHRSTGKQPRVPSAIHQFTNSGCFTSQFWWGDVRQPLAAIVIGLILQSQKFTAFCWCAHYSTTSKRSIQQSNRKVPMQQFVMFQRLLPSLCQSVSAPS